MRLLIAAPSAVMRAGLASLAASHPALSLAGAPVDPDGLGAAIDEARPDLLLIAVGPEDRLPDRAPPTILIASDPRADWIRDGFGRVILAVLPLDALPEEIMAACEAAAAGLVTARPEDMRAIASQRFPGDAPPLAGRRPRRSDGRQALSPREIEVLRMIADGLGNKAIAFRLGISEHTVKFHVASIMTKLGAASRTEAVTEGLRRGLIFL